LLNPNAKLGELENKRVDATTGATKRNEKELKFLFNMEVSPELDASNIVMTYLRSAQSSSRNDELLI
jgi:hypothetical protein